MYIITSKSLEWNDSHFKIFEEFKNKSAVYKVFVVVSLPKAFSMTWGVCRKKYDFKILK